MLKFNYIKCFRKDSKKMENSNLGLFLFAYIIEAIIQIVMLERLKKNHMTEDWLEFLEINIIVFMSDIFEYIMFANDATGLSSALSCIAVCGFILFTNSILLIIGLAIKNKSIQKIDEMSDKNEKNDENEKKSNKTSFLRVSMIILVFNLLIIFLVPIFTKQGTTNKVEDKVLNYLEQKYGNGNFKIVNVMKNYITNGFLKIMAKFHL